VKRRTITLAIEIEGRFPEAIELRDAIKRESPGGCRVVHIEIVSEGES
jgi:hypothetical protein